MASLRLFRTVVCMGLFLLAIPSRSFAEAQHQPWKIRAVIVTTFEVGEDTGDHPGEFQFWVEREHLTEVLDFPGGVHPIRTNKEHTVLGIVSGTTLVNASASLMALGLDPRFDLRQAYWLINGIAGVDPEDASIGSAAWANYIVNDVAREIDPREAPSDWPYGIFPIGATRPNEAPKNAFINRSNTYTLNTKLTEWAYQKTKDVPLMDTDAVKAFRARFIGYPNAQKPPFVLKGDTYASDFYWHGKIMNKFANDWVKLETNGAGNFVMTEMEDSGFAEALQRLDRMGRVDFRRVMLLRAGSNFSMQAPGHTAVESVTAPYIGSLPAEEAAYRVGSVVLHELVDHWTMYLEHVPGD